MNVKWFFQRVFRGYSDIDMADFCQFLCKKMLPYVKAWVALDRNGYPTDIETPEEWEEVLGKILWSLEESANWNKTEDKLFEKMRERGDTFADLDGGEIMEYWKRYQEGMELFGKYLPAMWL
jgi:hypothetical protein